MIWFIQNKSSLLLVQDKIVFVYTTSRPVWTNLLITYQVRPGPAVKGQSHFMPLTIHFEVAAVSFHSHLRDYNFLPSLGYFKYAPRICDFVKKPQAVFKSWIKNKSTIYEYRNNQAFIICSYYIASLPETWLFMLKFNSLFNRS